ncbi:MAG: sugar phosphate isomerase/epimerase [Actinomycetales bacterium]|nr:sugar phosphate isomerase/epimerase [Actinomycetales bacterium]
MMISIAMSTSCVYPLGVEAGFRIAREAGYDGVEVMVTNDPITQSSTALLELSSKYAMPILAIHAPVLLLTAFVWGRDPKVKLERSAELAAAVGAETVVVHPPFRWQDRYAVEFERIVGETARASGVRIAVENMFPWKVGGRNLKAYAPSSDPRELDVADMTLDFSHASLSGRDSLEMAMGMGSRLRHIHLCDGTRSVDEGMIFDEHLQPGLGTQPVAETLTWLAERHWSGVVAAEVVTRKVRDEGERLRILTETAAFAKRYVGQEHASREALEGVREPRRRSQKRAARNAARRG